jgi:hypothetical protein
MEKEAAIMEPVKELSQNDRIDLAIDKLNKNTFNIYFYCPPMNSPSGGVGVLLRLARNLKDSGFSNVKIVYEPVLDQNLSTQESAKQRKEVNLYSKFNPTWLEFNLSDIEFTPLGDKELIFVDGSKAQCKPLVVEPEDILIIPEGFPNIMKKTMQVACKRVVLAQSWFYVLGGLNKGEKWQHFGINDVISVSKAITDYLNAVMPGLNIKELKQGINTQTFKHPAKPSEKFPMIGFSAGRGYESQLKTYNVIKTFYAFYPHLHWVRFMELSNLSREEFAERLASCAFVLYTDEIAGFGTLPLEAMACNTHVVGWAAYGGREYTNAENGFWANNGDIFGLAELLGVAIDKWLNGEMDIIEIQQSYQKTLGMYTLEGEKSQIIDIINEYKNQRINELNSVKTQ